MAEFAWMGYLLKYKCRQVQIIKPHYRFPLEGELLDIQLDGEFFIMLLRHSKGTLIGRFDPSQDFIMIKKETE